MAGVPHDRDISSFKHGAGINDRTYCSLPQYRFIVREIYVKCIERLGHFYLIEIMSTSQLLCSSLQWPILRTGPRPVIESYRAQREASFSSFLHGICPSQGAPRCTPMSRFDIPGPLRRDDNCIVESLTFPSFYFFPSFYYPSSFLPRFRWLIKIRTEFFPSSVTHDAPRIIHTGTAFYT